MLLSGESHRKRACVKLVWRWWCKQSTQQLTTFEFGTRTYVATYYIGRVGNVYFVEEKHYF